MKTQNKIYFVFPVYNESLNIPRVIQDLVRLEEIVAKEANETQFIFIDDGSTDDTVAQLNQVGRQNLKVISHPQNQGPGAAFQTAFSYLIENGMQPDDLVITLEGDATSDPAVLVRMINRASEGDDIILASPYLYGGGFSAVESYRILLSHVANFLFKLILNIHGLATFSCFFRIYRGSALLKLNSLYPNSIVTSKGFDCAAEIIVKSVRNKLAISEVPFMVDWSRRKGRSKMKIVKTTVAYFKLFYKFSLQKSKA
ncbi:MAG: glycosyltransferase family 2 protein [Gammaproteobacteria bacterium]|nr:glycosyltransferase family 2 protein [Gammaproteobacteria bacterium]